MVVPPEYKEQILEWAHEKAALGTHVGRDKTFEVLLRNYWWKNMASDVAEYIRKCDV